MKELSTPCTKGIRFGHCRSEYAWPSLLQHSNWYRFCVVEVLPSMHWSSFKKKQKTNQKQNQKKPPKQKSKLKTSWSNLKKVWFFFPLFKKYSEFSTHQTCWTKSMADFQHRPQESRSPCGPACAAWPCFWGAASTAAQHGLLFSIKASTTQRPCNKNTMTHYNLDQRPRGCQFNVPEHIQLLLCPFFPFSPCPPPTPLPPVFPVWSFLHVLTLSYY